MNYDELRDIVQNPRTNCIRQQQALQPLQRLIAPPTTVELENQLKEGDMVTLSKTAAENNRIESHLYDLWFNQQIDIPIVELTSELFEDFSEPITTLHTPHRIVDRPFRTNSPNNSWSELE